MRPEEFRPDAENSFAKIPSKFGAALDSTLALGATFAFGATFGLAPLLPLARLSPWAPWANGILEKHNRCRIQLSLTATHSFQADMYVACGFGFLTD